VIKKILSEMEKNRPARLMNITCVYCGIEISADNDSKEHVISRKFVPKGSFDNQWNLIVQACKDCNGKKSDLENDISAITLELFCRTNENVPEYIKSDSQRKSKNCYSRQTRKLVKDSLVFNHINIPLEEAVNVDYSFKAPAQLNTERCFELAQYHLMALFYFLTFDSNSMKGRFWQDCFYPISQTGFHDWGNDEQVSFMREVSDWDPSWLGVTANGFFKSIIKKHPSKQCWSWALEWNKCYRLTGFFGCRETAERTINNICRLQWKIASDSGIKKIFVRTEIALNPDDDKLFDIKMHTS
jgi:hypothetical protein